MKTHTKVIISLVCLFVLAHLLSIDAFGAERGRYGRYIIHTTGDSAVNESARQGVVEHAGLTIKELPVGNGLVVHIPNVARGPLAGIAGVLAVEPDIVLYAVKPPADKPDKPGKPQPEPEPEQPPQEIPWGIGQIDAEGAWTTAIGSGVDIAIIDTGIDKDHLDLVANIAGGQNFIGKGPPHRRRVDPQAWDDDNGHGTHVAGSAAAVNNEIGVVGVAPDASLLAVKALDKNGEGYLSDIIDGIYWAADNGAEVINMSLGIEKEILDQYPFDLLLLKGAVDYAYDTGVVVVAAAGNEYPDDDSVIYPARFDSVIAVSATDNANNLASFSSTGPSVEFSAPGVRVLSTLNDGLYTDAFSGTSMAAPHVAGTAALVISVGVDDSNGDGFINDEVRLIMTNSATDLGVAGRDAQYGYGLVNAYGAVNF